MSKFFAYLSFNQPINSGVATHINWDTLAFDLLNEYDEVTNYEFVAHNHGYYFFIAGLLIVGLAGGDLTQLLLYHNGALVATNYFQNVGGIAEPQQLYKMLELNPNDTVHIEAWHNNGAPLLIAGNPSYAYFQGFRVY